MNLLDLVVGKPIKTSDERAEQIGPMQGIPIFGLDALSSAAYGPEAALSLLIPLGLLGVRYIVPISAAIITLLVIVYFSYRQTIAAYPSGGGSYTVARFNLGAPAGLLAAAALLADYILTAAVGISAGVGALVSAVPSLLPHTVSLCVGILIVITILNLRGVREAGTAFAIPTYLFVGTLLITIGAGVFRVLLSGGHPTPAVPLPPPPPMTEAVSYWLLLKVFASGCTALTGVEAVSNGVKAFREPAVKNARRTLTVIIFLLAVLLAGISLSRKDLRNCRNRSGPTRLPERSLHAHRRGFRQRIFLLSDHRLHPGGSFSFRQYRFRGFSAPLPRHRAKQLSAACFRLPRAAAGLHLRHRRPGAAVWRRSHSFWRCYRPADPALCRRRVSRLHAFASRHGHALEKKSRSELAEERTGEWTRRPRHRHHDGALFWLRNSCKARGLRCSSFP